MSDVNPVASTLASLDHLRLHEPGNPWSANSETYDREWQHFLEQRNLLVTQILDRLGLAQHGAAASGLGGPQAQALGDTLANQQVNRSVQQGAYQVPAPQDLNDLIGAAHFYGITDPEKIPPDVLQKMIRDSRLYMQHRRLEEGDRPWYRDIYDSLVTGAATIGLGMTHEVFHVAQRIPFIGDALARTKTIKDSDQWLSQIEEGYRGDLIGEDPEGLIDAFKQLTQGNEQAGWYVAHGLSGMLGYAIPATLSWRLAGAAGAMGSTTLGVGEASGAMGFIGRSALQGAAATWMIEGGGDAPLQERALKVGIGAGFGAAFEVVPMIFRRIKASFPTAYDRMPFTEPFETGRTPPTVDAEWAFADEPAGLLPSGGPPRGTAVVPYEGGGGGGGGGLGSGGLDEVFGLPRGQYDMPLAQPPQLPSASPGLNDPTQVQASRIMSRNIRAGFLPELETPPPTPFGPPKGPPQPMPPLAQGINPALVQPAWDVVSSRYPRLARTITAIRPLEELRLQGTTGMAYGGTTEAVYIDPTKAVDTSALFHELTHAAQKQMGLIGPDVPVTPELANRMEAFAYRTQGQYLRGVAAARADALAMSKHTTIMESPALADMATQPRFDDFDVAKAAVTRRPGGVSIVQGVTDTGKFIQQALRSQFEGGIGPQDFRLVQHPSGRMDVLVAGSKGISNKVAQQYKTYGMFTGQQATAYGAQVEILEPAGPDGMVQVRSIYAGSIHQIRGDHILPGRGSSGVIEAPSLYNDFRNHVLGYMEAESHAANLPQFGWLSSETSSQIPRLLEEFLEARGIHDSLTRAAMTNYFERMRVKDFRSLAPQETAEAAAIRARASEEILTAQLEGRVLERLPALAETRGFNVDVDPRDGAVVVHDALSNEVISVDDEASAEAFLSEFQREMPDLTPPGDVPAELMESVPGGVHPGISTDYEPQTTAEQVAVGERAIDRANSWANAVAPGGGSVGLPPQPPSIGPGPGPAPQGLLGGQESLGQQFRRLARDDPQRFQEMLDRMTSQAAQLFLPMRNWTLRGEEILHSFGIDRGVMWQQYNRATTGLDIAHNELTPYYNELNDIIRSFRRRLVRTGAVRDVMEASGPQAKQAMMDQHEFTPDERRAIERLNFFTHQVWFDARQAGFDIGYIPDYMPRLRAARAGGGDPFAANTTVGQQGQVFFEYAREGNLDVRERDAGVLLTHWVRSWKMAQHVQPALNDIIQTWQLQVEPQHSSIPNEIRRVMQDWVRVVRFGHGPEHEFAIQGVRRMLNSMGIPVTDGEVVSLYGSAFTNAYRSQLGFRPDVWFRDSIQPLLTGTKVGFGPVREAYMDFFRDGAAREQMWERALRGGWVVHGMVRVPSAEVFETAPVGAVGTDIFTPEEQARRESFSRIGDVLHDAAPKVLRGGMQGTVLDPLLVYTKEGEFNRLIAGEAGWRRATRAIAAWQQSGGAGDPITLSRVEEAAGAHAWRGPTQREFTRLLVSGAYDQAANLLANEAANMQFRYGTREASPAIQRAGMKGRFAMMFGTFTNQYMANMAELTARDIPAGERVKFLTRYSAVVAALAGASAATGWNFGKWQWHQSTTFAGGPPMHALIKAWYTLTGMYTGARNEAVNPENRQEYITPEQKTELQQWEQQAARPGQGLLPPIVEGMAETFFPYSGGLKTVHSIGSAIGAPGTAETLPQFILTGERPERTRQQNSQDFFAGMADSHTAAMDSLLRSTPTPGGGSRY